MHKKTIKVLHVIGSLGLGGAQVCVKYIAEYDCPEVENIIFPLRSKPTDIHIESKVVNLPYSNYNPMKFLSLVKFCRENKIDIMHAHLAKPIIGCLLATYFCDTKVIVHEHGPAFRRAAAFPGYRLLLKLLKKRAEIFIAVSEVTAEKLKKNFGIPAGQIQVIHNAVNTVVFDPEKYSSNLSKKALGINENTVVLGFVGRLSNQKGVDLIIKALHLLNNRIDKYILLIVGDGPERKKLENLACDLDVNEKVRFLGFCENIPSVISSFDVGLIPSRFEPFGMVAVEMMQMKIPIITSGVDGLGEFIINNHTGLVTDKNTSEEIARCIERILSDSQLRRSIVLSAYKKSDEFSISKYVNRIHQIYNSITKS